jgi:hypothetical protein
MKKRRELVFKEQELVAILVDRLVLSPRYLEKTWVPDFIFAAFSTRVSPEDPSLLACVSRY